MADVVAAVARRARAPVRVLQGDVAAGTSRRLLPRHGRVGQGLPVGQRAPARPLLAHRPAAAPVLSGFVLAAWRQRNTAAGFASNCAGCDRQREHTRRHSLTRRDAQAPARRADRHGQPGCGRDTIGAIFRSYSTVEAVNMHVARVSSIASVVLTALLALLVASPGTAATNAVKQVDPMIGTGGNGHTFPGATVPFGMIQLSPDTAMPDFKHAYPWAAGYQYGDHSILGFSETHF